MENVNCSASDHPDEVDYFEEDLVFSALNLAANFPIPPQKSSVAQDQDDEGESSFDQETRRIDAMIKKLEDSVIEEKDKDLSDLKCQLENKNTQIQQLEEKLNNLVDFITFMHGKFGSLMESMLSMIRSGDNESFLYFGPFNKARTKNEFVQILKDLSAHFSRDSEDLTGTREVMEKANSILKRMKKANQHKTTGNKHDSWSLTNDQSNASVSEDLNGGINCATLPVPTTPPLNLTMRAPLSSHRLIRRPPPSISRNSVQNDYGRNLSSVNKKHGVDHSKRHWGHFCLCRGTKFSSKTNLAMHIRYFTMDKKFKCKICKKGYLYPCMLRGHMISSHKVKSFIDGIVTCSICQESYRNYDEFCVHLETFHNLKERVSSSSSKRNTTRNGSVAQCSRQDIQPTPTLERNSTLTLHYASVDGDRSKYQKSKDPNTITSEQKSPKQQIRRIVKCKNVQILKP